MAAYTAISAEEIESLMATLRYVGVKRPGVNERVYAKLVTPRGAPYKVSVGVYSTVPVNADEARDCGDDAIRVMIHAKAADRLVLLYAAKRTHRVGGWRKNLTGRIGLAESVAGQLVPCPACGAPTKYAKNRSTGDPFLGCCRFPRCRGSIASPALRLPT